VVAARTATCLRGQRFARFWWMTAILFAYVACDDLFVIHERLDRLGHRLLGLDPDNDVTDHFDDAIVGAYGTLALAMAWRDRAHLLRLVFMQLTMIPAFGAFLVMLVLDWKGGHKAAEDSFKILAGALILVGFLAGSMELRQRQRRAPESRAPV
jgi:hypothetical protein